MNRVLLLGLFLLLQNNIAFADLDETFFKGTKWVQKSGGDGISDYILEISDDLSWNISFKEDDKEFSGKGSRIVILAGPDDPDSKLLVLMSKEEDSEDAMMAFAIVQEDEDISLVYDSVTLVKKDDVSKAIKKKDKAEENK